MCVWVCVCVKKIENTLKLSNHSLFIYFLICNLINQVFLQIKWISVEPINEEFCLFVRYHILVSALRPIQKIFWTFSVENIQMLANKLNGLVKHFHLPILELKKEAQTELFLLIRSSSADCWETKEANKTLSISF